MLFYMYLLVGVVVYLRLRFACGFSLIAVGLV